MSLKKKMKPYPHWSLHAWTLMCSIFIHIQLTLTSPLWLFMAAIKVSLYKLPSTISYKSYWGLFVYKLSIITADLPATCFAVHLSLMLSRTDHVSDIICSVPETGEWWWTMSHIQEHNSCKHFHEIEIRWTCMIRLIEPSQTDAILSTTELKVLSDS